MSFRIKSKLILLDYVTTSYFSGHSPPPAFLSILATVVTRLLFKYVKHTPASGLLHILFLVSEMTSAQNGGLAPLLPGRSLLNVLLIIETCLTSLYKIQTYIHPNAYHYTLSSFLFLLSLVLAGRWCIWFCFSLSLLEYEFHGGRSAACLVYCDIVRAHLAHSRCSINICGFSFEYLGWSFTKQNSLKMKFMWLCKHVPRKTQVKLWVITL